MSNDNTIETTSRELIPQENTERSHAPMVQVTSPIGINALIERGKYIEQAMGAVLKEGIHYGTIPGAGDKKVLKKEGAEKLGMMFRLIPTFETRQTDYDHGHREYIVSCTLKDPNGNMVGQGIGSCSTLESKYRWRKGERKCPQCGTAAIIKGKAEYGGGWICFNKKGGCGAKFGDNDTAITKQSIDRVENPDIADLYNTVLKMGKKRAFVDSILTCTAASDTFTQDIEEGDEEKESSQQKPQPRREEPRHVEADEVMPRDARIPPQEDLDWSAYQWRLHLPYSKNKEIVDKATGLFKTVDVAPLMRDAVKRLNFKFHKEAGPDGKDTGYWYGNKENLNPDLASYHRPLDQEREDLERGQVSFDADTIPF